MNLSNAMTLLDCRPYTDYLKGHIKNAYSLPATEFFQRMHELPPRNQVIILCGDPDSIDIATPFLTKRGYFIQQTLLLTEQTVTTLKQQSQWQTQQAAPPLWQPASVVKHFIEQLAPNLPPTNKQGLDIACGAGRDMVYLAQHGWKMTGVDHHNDALQRCQSLAMAHGVQVSTQSLELESSFHPNPFTPWPAASFDLICVVRYLHRPLFPAIKTLLKPNGILLYQTFMLGCEKISTPRNPRFLLQAQELAETFAAWSILYDQVEYLADGRPMNAFIAQKKPD